MKTTNRFLSAAISIALAFTLSCSSNDGNGGQGGSFNVNSQIYIGFYDENDNENIGEAYNGSGDIAVTSYECWSVSCIDYENYHIGAGSHIFQKLEK